MFESFPRYALFGNGVDAWEIDLLFGDAAKFGQQSIKNISIFTAQREIKLRSNLEMPEAYVRAKETANSELKKLVQNK
jgi:hypothetical protein